MTKSGSTDSNPGTKNVKKPSKIYSEDINTIRTIRDSEIVLLS